MINVYKDNDVNTHCLPIVYPPLMKSYLSISILSNIIAANSGKIDWLIQNFIQLFVYEEFDKLEFFPTQSFLYLIQNIVSCYEITGQVLEKSRLNIIDDIISWINKKMYVVIYLDESRLPNLESFDKEPVLHPQFIFGYNTEKRVFKVMNFASKSRDIEIIDVDFELILETFYAKETEELFYKNNVSQDLANKAYRILLLTYNENQRSYVDNSLNEEAMKIAINQYCNACDSSLYTYCFTGREKGKWGIAVYDEIKRIVIKQKEKLDIRIPCLLFEHKYYMKLRLSYIDNNIAEQYAQIVKKAQVFKLLSLKYVLKKDDNLINELLNLLDELKEKEKAILMKVN